MNILNDRDNLFLLFHFGIGIILMEIWFIKYILHCYLNDNVWWGNSFEWIGTVIGWVL